MDHPLLSDTNKELRSRVIQLLKNGFSILRQSNIVFVCGGNEDEDMRRQFQKKFAALLPEHEFFEPEFAMLDYFSMGDTEPFDIADFEKLIGDLSLAIVLFPEAPGSFAELGYFSGQEDLVKKIVLALDSNHQRSDSFISLGPASKVDKKSIFKTSIQMDYQNPDFSLVSQRIVDRVKLKGNRRQFSVVEFSKMSSFELFALAHQLVELLVIATTDDIEFFLTALFGNHFSASKVKKIISILLGSKRLIEIGDYGHLTVHDGKPQALQLRDGFKTAHSELTVDISAQLFAADGDFQAILKELD
ncbi:retron St85 family effector protein [Cognatishimia activa]|uniref:retron St85 family effector protein n=1 Tax=Cognatishimia activa TaxID=1715691 RepID=UPI00223197BB|nr:retron St85 family effector protein [Cognatishimia activa]UZD90321.1 retron St85 family effector protein [Cognatishimia activa]